MAKAPNVVFLFDVDNTLIDNDRVQAHLKEHLAETYGTATRDRYWEILEQLREELGYVDYLGALERYRVEALHRPEVLRMSSWLVDYPFADRLYPGALDAVKHVQQWGTPVILSDGDAVFQPRKVERSGLWQAFDGSRRCFPNRVTTHSTPTYWPSARQRISSLPRSAISLLTICPHCSGRNGQNRQRSPRCATRSLVDNGPDDGCIRNAGAG
jgi:hypothetical protein